jgi:hypothetical protein
LMSRMRTASLTCSTFSVSINSVDPFTTY